MHLPSFRNRRRISMVVTLIALLIVAAIAWHQEGRPAHASTFTGTTVLASILLLALLGVRRRVPVLPLGSVSTWTQIHLYLGLFSAGVYVMHVPALIGSGVFGGGLSILFLMVTASGFYGIYASRTLPKRLTAVEGKHRLDRVGWHRSRLAEKSRELLDELNEQAAHGVVGSFYTKYLNPFFNSRPSLAQVLVPSGARRRRLLTGLEELGQYLETEDQATAGRLAALVRDRDDLDYQYALRLRLRVWLVVHGLSSVALIAGGLAHAAMVWRFGG